MMTKTLHQEVIAVTAEYLGPASERFINRQIANHLQKQPDELTTRDLTKLIDWIVPVVALLTENKVLVQGYADKLQTLASKRS